MFKRKLRTLVLDFDSRKMCYSNEMWSYSDRRTSIGIAPFNTIEHVMWPGICFIGSAPVHGQWTEDANSILIPRGEPSVQSRNAMHRNPRTLVRGGCQSIDKLARRHSVTV